MKSFELVRIAGGAGVALLFSACVEDLGGNGYGGAVDVNNHDVAVGYSLVNGALAAVKFMTGREVVPLPLPDGAMGTANAVAIADDGTIVGGYSSLCVTRSHVLRWSPSGQVEDLGQLEPSWATHATDINNDGVIVGTASDLSGVVPDCGSMPAKYPWIYEPRVGHMVRLPVLPDAGYATATSINDGGVIVGVMSGSDPQQSSAIQRVVKWAPGTHELTILPSPPGGRQWDYAYHINSSGAVVGTSDGRPVLWPADGSSARYLSSKRGTAWSINDAGVIVGSLSFSTGDFFVPEPVVWRSAGDPGTQLAPQQPGQAAAVNNWGTIVGTASSRAVRFY